MPAPATIPPTRRPRWQRWLIDAVLIALVFAAVQLWQTRHVPAGPAPAFAGPLAAGGQGSLAAWRAAHPGGPVAVYFWADWCPICQTTAGNVSKISADWPVTSIATQSGTPAKIAKFMQEKGYRWPTLPDPQGKILSQYGLPGTPAFVIINPAGDIRFVSVGFTSEIGLRLRLWWASRENP